MGAECGGGWRLPYKTGHPKTPLRWGEERQCPAHRRGRPLRTRRDGYATSPALPAEGATTGCPPQRCHPRATHGCLCIKALAWKGPAGFPRREARASALHRYPAARHPRTSCVTVPRAGLRFPPLLLQIQGHAHWRAQVPRPVGPSEGPDWRASVLKSQWCSRMPLATPSQGAGARPHGPSGARSRLPAPFKRAAPCGRCRL